MCEILELIKKYGISIRQIPEYNTQTLRVNNYTEQFITSEYEIKEVVLKENVTIEKYNALKHQLGKSYFDNGKVYVYVATKRTKNTHGGMWLSKQVKNNDSTIIWNLKKDNLANTLEDSIKMCVKQIHGSK